MADTKITALTALTAADPANDVIPIVDVSDTTMAASGTTKKISVNNILGASGTATLASATITGDLTVDTSTLKVDSTNNRVGIVQATPLYPLHLVGEFGLEEASAGNGTKLRLIGDATKYNFRLGKQLTATNTFEITPSTAIGGTTFSNPVYTVTYDGIHTFLDGAGGTRMTLNSTGLGVGIAPSYRLTIGAQNPTGGNIAQFYNNATSSLNGAFAIITQFGVQDWYMGQPAGVSAFTIGTGTTSKSEFFRIDGGGNVGVGVTPSAWASGFKVVQFGPGSAISCNTNASRCDVSANYFYDGANKFITATGYATNLTQENGNFYFYRSTATSGGAGAACTFTQAMTLNATGSLLVGATTLSANEILRANSINSAQWAVAMTSVDRGWLNRQSSAIGGIAAFFEVGSSNTNVGSITTTASATAYVTVSDYRLKENVQPLVGGLARISALKPSIYKWKVDGSNGEGFIAHELADIVPAAVTGKKDDVNADGTVKAQGVDLSKVVPILVAAIQELTAEVNALKNA